MSEKEYIVTLNKNVDYEAFDKQMVADTGAGAIPNRSTPVANARPGSKRNTHYMLTDDEAAALKDDPRVMGVEIPPEQRDDIVIGHRAVQTGDFTKTTEDRGFFINWGLRRINEITNPYNSEGITTGGYNYTLDGSGVDIVIQDSGIQADHPDFNDSEGVSRVEQLDWYTASGLPGTMPTNHYTDLDGHGTHCAGIAAGLTYGMAKGAKIYAVKVRGLEGPTDPNLGIPTSDCFDVIKEWHNNKPIDPVTGAKRPTIVNMSWGYFSRWNTVSEINYRGVSYTGADINTTDELAALGLIPISDGVSYISASRIASVDADVQELIDAGVHVCIAAGNNYHKVDVEDGIDYNNYAQTDRGRIYYHRGSSPFDNEAHNVGNIDSALDDGGLEQKAQSSTTGPGVSIWAAGTNIMSTTSTVNKFTDGPYPGDTDFRICNISGTSMASPQIAGLLTLYTQLNPGATPAQAKAFIEATAAEDVLYSTDLDNDHDDYRSLQGSANAMAFNKFNSSIQLTLGPAVVQEVAVPPALTPSYEITPASNNINEGSALTFTVTTTNVDDATTLYWTVTSGSDFGVSNGSFIVSGNSGSFTVTPTSDETTEGAETFTASVRTESVNGTVVATSIDVTINDTSTTPEVDPDPEPDPSPDPTYSVEPASTNINEGSALTFNVTTTNVDDATTLYWTIQSNAEDFTTSSGNFTINSDSGSFTVTPDADETTEGAQAFTVAIRTGGIGGTIVDTSVAVTINDTSISPEPDFTPDYTITVTNSGNSYLLSGTDRNGTFTNQAQPALAFNNGDNVRFNVNAGTSTAHPFYIKTVQGSGTGNQVSGVDGQATTQLDWTTNTDGTGTYYYQCSIHSGMNNTITIS